MWSRSQHALDRSRCDARAPEFPNRVPSPWLPIASIPTAEAIDERRDNHCPCGLLHQPKATGGVILVVMLGRLGSTNADGSHGLFWQP